MPDERGAAQEGAGGLNPPPLTNPHAPAPGGATPAGEPPRPPGPPYSELVARIVPGYCVCWRGVGSHTVHPPDAWHLHCGACDAPTLDLCFTGRTHYRFDDFVWVVTELPLVGFTCEDCGRWNAVPAMLGEGGILPRLDRSQPTQPEDLLAFSRPPARFSSSPDGSSSPSLASSFDAAQPPAPLPRPPGSGSGET